jgi:phage shock protein E
MTGNENMNWKSLSGIILFVAGVLVSSISVAKTVWIDVRSSVEHSIDSIEGDVRISHEDVVHEVTELYPDTSTEIHLYCRSGGRAGKAMSALKEAGYTNVSNAGGIDDARKERGLNQ